MTGHSVQIVILDPVEHRLDGCIGLWWRAPKLKIIASGEFSQVVQSDEVTMRLAYKFVDGSIDDETIWVCKMSCFPWGEKWIVCVYDDALQIS